MDFFKKAISPERFFFLSIIGVNGINYLYNLIIGRMVGPRAFADIALIISMLLISSFVATTFQIVTTKFEAQLESHEKKPFYVFILKKAFIIGLIIACIIYIGSGFLQKLLHTQSAFIFQIFAISIPIYFLMSVNRGIHQGKQHYFQLAISYISEALVKLVLSVVWVYFAVHSGYIGVSTAVLLSIMVAIFPISIHRNFFTTQSISPLLIKKVLTFFTFTLLYELIQVFINSSDIFMVKIYFNEEQAGLYASIALIGRLIYFITWMLIMLMLPKIIETQKKGWSPFTILKPYLIGLVFFIFCIILICSEFSETIVLWMFGNAFTEIHFLLYEYAIATSLFALSNFFIYYYLSLENYTPIYIALIFGILQIALIYFFHSGLQQVVEMQIIAMGFLLMIILIYVYRKERKFEEKITMG